LKVTWGLGNASYNPKTITTLGSYDGMHKGHIEILQRLLQKKGELGLDRSLVITFDPHPQEILQRNNSKIALLTTIDERLGMLEKCGIDETLVIRFSVEFAKTSYTNFFQNIIVNALGTKAMVVGFNHAFGKNREGDIEHLEKIASEASVAIEEIPPLIIDGVSISSTKIRHALFEGDIALANKYLGRAYEVSGVVEHGDMLGRKLGFATANLKVPENKLIPCDGVYAGKAIYENNSFPAAISIGNRPTIESGGQRKIEAFILDFEQEIYEKHLTIKFLSYIREQKKFDSYAELTKQMEADVLEVRFASN
jgi:riboflavin kinase/FMN adenylyltransferase